MSEKHNQDNNINSKDFLLGTLMGSIIGASVALLFAPKSGKELRQDINQGAQYVRERAEGWKDIAVEKGSEWKTAAMEKTGQYSFADVTKGVGEKVKSTKDQLQNKVAQFRSKEDKVENAIEDLADAIDEAAEELDKKDE